MIRTTITLFVALLFSPWASATEMNHYKQIVVDSLRGFENNNKEQWAYTIARESGSGKEKYTSVETYSPNNPKHWTLVKEYDKEPSENRISEYNDIKAAEQKQTQQQAQPAEQKLIDMIQLDSLALLASEQDQVHLAFTPKMLNMHPAAVAKLTGLLILDRKHKYVRQMRISNIDTLKPAENVSLSYFAMDFQFTLANKQMLPKEVTIDFKGKMDANRAISQHSKESYFDYQFIDDGNKDQ